MNEKLSALLTRLRKEKPLVHHITNNVVTNFTANGTLAIGASPVMASDPQEVADMVKHAQALVLNIGTLTSSSALAMERAGQVANRLGIPVILDPVGYGATPFRNETVNTLLRKVAISLVRGNAAEIAALCNVPWKQKGVDAAEDGDRIELARAFVKKYAVPVAITGKVDVISNADGDRIFTVANGHSLLPYITGSGCLATALIGAFHAVTEEATDAALAGLCTIGVAAEKAAQRAKGPGEMNWRLLDSLYLLTADELAEQANITIEEGRTA